VRSGIEVETAGSVTIHIILKSKRMFEYSSLLQIGDATSPVLCVPIFFSDFGSSHF